MAANNSIIVQLRRGNTAQTSVFTGALAEITVDTDKKTLVVHDGVTQGGYSLALESAQQDSFAFAHANSSYNQANTATTNAATADQRAVTSGVYANSAYTQANTATTNAATADQRAVTSGSYANSAYSKANTGTILAQAAFDSANNVGPQVQPAFNQANAAFNKANTGTILAQAAFDSANNVGPQVQPAFNQANAAFNKANSSFNYANTIIVFGDETLTTNTANQVIDSYSTTEYRTAKYIVQAISGADVHSEELLVTHNDTDVFFTEYAVVTTANSLFNVYATIQSANVTVNVSPVSADTQIDFSRISIIARILASLEGDLMSLSGTEDLGTGSGTVDLNA